MNRNVVLLSILGLALLALAVFAWYTYGDSDAGQPPPVQAEANWDAPVISADYERALGSPKAPLKVIEYAAPMCPVCAAFDMNEFPKFKAQYIDTGKVYYIFRVFPIGNPDYGVEGIARCLPKDQYFTFIDMMYHHQAEWDPDGHDIPDVKAALVKMAGKAGVPEDQAALCIHDDKVIANTTQIQQDAAFRFGVHGTPTFIIDGEPAFSGDWPFEQMKQLLDAKLAK